jgi:multidrug efflux pump
MARFFIDRPIFASVISIVIVLAGLVAMKSLPIAQYPDISPPTVTVTATYPGATAETIANTVAAPIEQQVNGVDNMMYMTSTSSSTGNMTLIVTFEAGTDPDIAQVNVQNRVSQAAPQLPSVVVQQGVKVEKKSQAFMMVIGIYSPNDRYDSVYINNYTNLYVLDAIKRLPGANMSTAFGSVEIAMRVWLQPDKMAQLGITTDDVAKAIQAQNKDYGVGVIGQSPTSKTVEQTFVMTTKGSLSEPEEFENIILRTDQTGSAIVRLRDVGRVEIGARDYNLRNKLNGKDAAMLSVYQQPGANAIETSRNVRATLEELKKSFPSGLDYKIVLDTSLFTVSSIDKVVHTFYEAVALVIVVVFIFLQTFRATVIPIIAVPVAIIGAFIGMIALGFSINMLTLFGMILAIGLVVDDAIVVVESVELNMHKFGLSPKEATKRSMDEISGALVAIVLVLVSVFVPVAFLGGMTGTLYKQFAITIAISVVLSGIVALTLSPALAAIILKPTHSKKNFLFRAFEYAFGKLTDLYVIGVKITIRFPLIALCLFAALLWGTVHLYKTIPTSFVPDEDQGYVFGVNMMPDSASLDRTVDASTSGVAVIKKNEAVQDIAQVDGYSLVDGQTKTNAGTLFVSLKPFEERHTAETSSFTLLKTANGAFRKIEKAILLALNPPAIPGLGTTGGFEFYIQDRGAGNPAKLFQAVQGVVEKAKKRPELQGVSSTFVSSSQQMYLELDRSKAELLGAPVDTVFQSIQTFFGSAYVAQFTKFSRVWWVIVQGDSQYRSEPKDLDKIYIRSKNGSMVPLNTLVRLSYKPGPSMITRFNNFPAAKVTGSQAPGYSSGQAIAAMEEISKESLPADYSYAWSGQAYEEKKSGGTSASVFVFGLIMVFLILAAQYERWTLPLGVMLAVPFALFGALAAIYLVGLQNDVYFQIGLVVLIGLAAKNAILIIEFAVELRHQGKTPHEAAIEAARLRLRPIIMTSLAFGLGCVPMAIATGAGANSLRSIGTGVIGGMLGSTIISIFYVPLFFVLIERMSGLFSKKSGKSQSAVETEHASEAHS